MQITTTKLRERAKEKREENLFIFVSFFFPILCIDEYDYYLEEI